MTEQAQPTDEQKIQMEQQILTGKRGHSLDMAIRIQQQDSDGEKVIENAKKFFEFIQNG